MERTPSVTATTNTATTNTATKIDDPCYHHPDYVPVRFEDLERDLEHQNFQGLHDIIHHLGLDYDRHYRSTGLLTPTLESATCGSDVGGSDIGSCQMSTRSRSERAVDNDEPACPDILMDKAAQHSFDHDKAKVLIEMVKRIIRRLAEEAGVVTVSSRYKRFEQLALGSAGGYHVDEFSEL